MSEAVAVEKKYERSVFSIQQPSYVRPKVNESKLNGGYHTFGDDNNYPEYLINIYFGSSQHQGIIQRKVDEILGDGLVSTSGNKELEKIIDSCNTKGQSLNDVLRKAVNDNEIIGGFALQIVYGLGSTKEKPIIAELYYVDITKLRFNKTYTKVLYCKHWNKSGTQKVIKYDLYDPNNPTGTKIYYYSGTMTREWYPIPQYIGSIPAIETAIDIANFNQNTLRNGFFPSIHAHFFDGEPTEEEKGFIEKSIQEKWGGTSNTGRFMISFSDADGQAPTFEPIEQPDLDKRFAELKTSVIEDIFIGHRITDPSMFGLAVAGKLGGAKDYTQSYAIFQNVYVRPQRKILMSIFNDIIQPMIESGIEADLSVSEIEPVNNVFTDEGLIASQMTPEEIRTLLKKWGYIKTVEVAKGQNTLIDTTVDGPKTDDKGNPIKVPAINKRMPVVKLAEEEIYT